MNGISGVIMPGGNAEDPECWEIENSFDEEIEKVEHLDSGSDCDSEEHVKRKFEDLEEIEEKPSMKLGFFGVLDRVAGVTDKKGAEKPEKKSTRKLAAQRSEASSSSLCTTPKRHSRVRSKMVKSPKSTPSPKAQGNEQSTAEMVLKGLVLVANPCT